MMSWTAHEGDKGDADVDFHMSSLPLIDFHGAALIIRLDSAET